MVKKTTEKKPKKTKKRIRKKPLPVIIKIFFFVLLILFSTFTYLSITLAISPRSIPIVTKNIESLIEKLIKQDVQIRNSHLQITRSLNLKIVTQDVSIIDDNNQSTITTLPIVNIEIPIYSMVFGNFSPKRFIIEDANLNIDHRHRKNAPEESQNKDAISPILNATTNFFINLKDNFHSKSLFEIKNTNITIIDNNSSKNLYIKNSKINSYYNFGKLLISFKNEITINETPFNLKIRCIVSDNKESNCHLQTTNFSANSFSWIHDDLKLLDNINATFHISSRIKYNKYGLDIVEFDTNSQNGNFKYDNFFNKTISFNQLHIKGTYHHQSKNLNIENIAANFKKEHKNYKNYHDANPILQMSLNILEDKELYNITLNDIAIEDLDKFWPANLAKEGSRKWSITHLKSGLIKNATAKIETKKTKLTDVKANIKLEDATIKYSPKFPPIFNTNANIDFDKKSMKVRIIQAKTLQSTVSDSLLTIDNFKDKNARLNIKANIQGLGSNILEHISYQSKFATAVKKYFNGQATSFIELSIPITKSTSVNSLSLNINSNIQNNNNHYLRGNANMTIQNKVSSSNFDVQINASQSKVNCDILGIHKQKNKDLKLNLVVDAKDLNKIKVKNIQIKTPNSTKEISALLEFDTNPFKITKLNLTNSNFNDNNYDLTFNLQDKKLTIKGNNLNLAKALESKNLDSPEDSETDLDFTSLHIVLNKLSLAHNNNLNDAYLFYDCPKGLCKDGGVISLRKEDKQFLKLDIKAEDENSSKINAKIFDVGELAESLGISNLIKNGKAKITALNTPKNNKFSLTGEIEIDNDITIFENESVKLLEKDTLYSTIKDKIFPNQKTTFKKVKIKFELTDKILTIKSLIAHNYKIGITTKGTIDLKNGIYNLQGFILPGYIINNLFGLGDIPIIGEIANLLTNGQDGGVFGIKYEYSKKKNEKDFHFKTNKMSALVPTTIQGMF
ncbi:MAG: hypothetical protein ISQ34_03225 [Rickettsiales bacterium]|nr:hypothetical protein [Rickettsiales bacterium]